MINNITGAPGINVMPGNKPYITISGVVRWNGSQQRLEVMDRDSWMPLDVGSSWTIAPDYSLTNVINWVNIKIAKEEQLQVLMDKHPGLKDLKEKFDIMLALVQNGEFTEHK
jgi:hypothetical protein